MHWLSHLLGLDNASGALYLWWSGIFGDATIIGGVFLLYWHHTCHQQHCWRLARHTMDIDGVDHALCRRHHPGIVHKHLTAEQVANAQKARTGRR